MVSGYRTADFRSMHLLFVKQSQVFPRSSGHDVHTYHMMRSFMELGCKVSFSTLHPPSQEAIAGLRLTNLWNWNDTADVDNGQPLRLSRLQERFRSYWGIAEAHIKAVRRQAQDCQADAVVAVGLEVLPILAGVQKSCRVWYAADEWVWHHLSVVRIFDPKTWGHLKTALIKGLYEFSFRNAIDRAWVVSNADRTAMKLFARIRNVDVVPNGVDTDHFRPLDVSSQPASCVFWGRLDFEPNIQALQWFCKYVWPKVLQLRPDAQLRILGFCPTAQIKSLAELQGVSVTGDLPDLREEISRSQVVVLPFHSGGGIKNKLLEAAAMAKPIICSRRAANGLVLPAESPLIVAENDQAWINALDRLWAGESERKMLGVAARQWVQSSHSWQQAARCAEAGLAKSLGSVGE